MKTKLLILLLFAFSFGNAQINFSEGFESGTFPSGWMNNNFSINNTSSCSGTYGCTFTTFGAGSGAEVSSPTYVSNGGSISVSCDYKRNSSAGSGILYLQYYNFTTSSWVNISVVSTDSTICTTVSGTIPAGTIPAGNNVAFKVYLYASNNNAMIFKMDNFTAIENVPQSITQYNFDNSYTNISGNAPFSSSGVTTFDVDRHGNANGALVLFNTGSTATIPNLPYGSSSRTISVWAKTFTLNTTINYVFHYGNAANGNGCAFRPSSNLYFANGSASIQPSATSVNATWYHFVCTYDGTTAKIYRNGTLLSSAPLTFNTANNTNIFKLGLSEDGFTGYFNGAIDDLKIYNYALSQADITSLYNNNSLSFENFDSNNFEVSLYPNPVNDILNIETTLELKSIEIFNIQGQKVIESNQKQINVSNLSSGMYMVKIQDLENNLITKKVIIN